MAATRSLRPPSAVVATERIRNCFLEQAPGAAASVMVLVVDRIVGSRHEEARRRRVRLDRGERGPRRSTAR